MTCSPPRRLMVSGQVATTLAVPACLARGPLSDISTGGAFARKLRCGWADGRLTRRTHGDRVVQPGCSSWSRSPSCGQAASTSPRAGDDSRGRAKRSWRRALGWERRITVARAVGPAIAGVVIVVAGRTGVSRQRRHGVGCSYGLWRWRREPHRATLPAERMASAVSRRHPVCPVSAGVAGGHVRRRRSCCSRKRALVAAAAGAKTSLGRGPIAYGALLEASAWGGGWASIFTAWRRRNRGASRSGTVGLQSGCLALAWVREFGVLNGRDARGRTAGSSWCRAYYRGAAGSGRVGGGRAPRWSTLITCSGSFASARCCGVVAAEAGIPSALMAPAAACCSGWPVPPVSSGRREGLKLDPATSGTTRGWRKSSRPRRGRCLVTVEYTLEPRQRRFVAAALRRQVAADSPAGWRRLLGAVRGCGEPAPLCRVLFGRIVGGAPAATRSHDQSDREVEDALRTFYSAGSGSRISCLQAPDPTSPGSRWRLVR